MPRTAASPRSSASPAASLARQVAPSAASTPGTIASSLRIGYVPCRKIAVSRTSLPLHVHGVVLDANRVGRHVARDGPAQELAGPHVEAGVVQRAFDHVAYQLAGGERRARVAANVAQRVEG